MARRQGVQRTPGTPGGGAKRRAYGQHFLADATVVERIFAALALDPLDHVLEIGPGTGALTARLAQEAGSVVAVEIDPDLAAPIKARLPRVDVVCADALAVDLRALLDRAGRRRRRLVGNLPYSIASPLLERLFDDRLAARDMHFMVQAEVARRLAAPPGGRTYGRLSVIAQWHCRIQLLFEVAPGSFSPPPKVRSAFLRLVPRSPAERLDCDPRALRHVARVAFSKRRKTLANALESIPVDWHGLDIDPRNRPENLSVADFVAIANGLPPTLNAEMTRERI